MTKILDQFGKPIDLAAMRQPQSEQLANIRSLQSEHDEHPARGLTPSRIHAILRQAEQGDWLRQIELADDMEERDPQIYSELDKRKRAILKLDWDIAPPAGASAAEKAQAEQVKEWVQALPNFKRTVVWPLLDAILKGFAAVEMWWQPDQGVLTPRFSETPQRWFCLSEDRRNIHLRDSTAYGQPLNAFNWLAHRHPARSGYPARQALSRVLMFPFLYKHYSTADLAEFLEIYGLPLRLGKYPGGATDKEKLTLLRAVTEIGHNAAGIIPEGMSIEFQNAAQGTQVPFEAMLNRMDAAISKAIIGQTLTSGEGQHGTQALGNVHNEIRLDILAADAELVAATITQQLVAPMALLNIAGATPKRLPSFVLEVPEPQDIKLMAEALPKLASAGVQIGANWVAAKLRIPALDPGEQPLKVQPTAQPGDRAGDGEPVEGSSPVRPTKTTTNAMAILAALAALPKPEADFHDALDTLTEEATTNPAALMAGLVQPLMAELDAAIAAGESAEAFAERVPALLTRMQGGALADQVARASFIAQLAGLANVDLNTGEVA